MIKNKKINLLPKITNRQLECLQFIASYLYKNSYYPTQREIAIGLNIRSNTAHSLTDPLQKKEYLYVDHKIGRRNLRLTNNAYELLNRYE